MSSNTEHELIKEVLALRKELKELSEAKEVQSLSAFYTEDLENKIKLVGILLAEGNWGGIYWGGEEIKRMVKKYKDILNNMELTAEHEKDDSWGGKKRGYHEKVTYNDKLKAAIYEGIVDDNKAIKAIKDGFFKATSMRIGFTPKFIDGRKIATNLKPINNTLTAYPACKNCNIFNWKDLSKDGSSIEYFGIKEKDLSKDNSSYTDVSDITMSNETEFEDINLEEEIDLMTKFFELKSDLVGVLPDSAELGDKEGVIKLELMTEDEAKARGKSIVYYYPEGKYRNRARHIVRRNVNGEFSYYPLYRSGQPIPYSLLSRPSVEEEATDNKDEPEEPTTENEEVNNMSENPETPEPEPTPETPEPEEETPASEETPEPAEVVKPVPQEVIVRIEVPKPEPRPEEPQPEPESETPEEESAERPASEKPEPKEPPEEEATIVETPAEEPTKPVVDIKEWSTPEKAAEMLLFRERKEEDEY